MRILRMNLLGTIASVALGVAAATLPAQIPSAIEVRVPKPPTVAVSDSGAFLAYELHVTNLTTGALDAASRRRAGRRQARCGGGEP